MRDRLNFSFPIKLIFYTIIISYAVIALAPFVFSFLSTFKSSGEITRGFTWLPQQFTFEHWQRILTGSGGFFPIHRWFLNSAIYAVTVTLGQLMTSALAGYALARLKFPFRNGIFLSILSTMMIPGMVIIVPQYLLLSKLNWINTYQGLIIPCLVNAFLIFMMRQYFLSVPKELEEAARIDGLSRFGIFLRIVLPLAKPALSACTIFAFMGAWNNFMYPLTIARKQEMHVMTVGLQNFKNLYYTEWGPILVGSIIMMVPILVIFFLFQKHFIKGISTTGLK